MSTRPKGFGLTAELNRKKEAKFDAELAIEILEWMKEVFTENDMGEEANIVSKPIQTQDDVKNLLKDGILLCKIVNIISPSSVKRINTSKMAFKQMENINNFLKACEENLGCRRLDLFQSVDLYEGQNIPQVINGIIALGRKAQTCYSGAALGPAEATENKREFTDEQLRARDGIIGLQAGSNLGASQSGQNFGKTRAIID